MKKKTAVLLCMLLAVSLLAGCGTEKFDTSAPYSFQDQEAAQPGGEPVVVTEGSYTSPALETDTAEGYLPVAEEALPAPDAELAADSLPEAEPEAPAPAEEPEAAGVDTLPLEPAGDEGVGPGEGPLAAADDGEITAPYALEEEEPQRYASPAEEAAALGLEEEVPQDSLLAEDVTGQTFAVAMAYWDSGYSVDKSPADPVVAWDALGWYAAWVYRTEGFDLISAETAEDFLRSIGCVEDFSSPEAGMRYGAPESLRARDGVYYDFAWYRARIDEVLGVEAEFSITPSADGAVDAVVTQHFDAGMQADRVYTMTWGKTGDPDSEFAWTLRSLTLPEFAPEVDPALNFTWEELKAANTLENVLAQYPAVRSYSSENAEGGSTWLFVRGGRPALVSEGPGYCSGQYHGCWFDYEAGAADELRARIGAFDAEAGTWDGLNDFLLQNFEDAAALRLDRVEGDLIWADCLYRGGERQKLAFDRATLALRELVVLSADGEVLGSNLYDYSEAEPAFAFLDSWDRTLRTVTVTWEDYDGGVQNRYTETVEIPQDWEYLPYEGRWGDYTLYNNTDYLGDYEYPGDGEDYKLFLTTVKG